MMQKVNIGDFVRTVHGYNGILTNVVESELHGNLAVIVVPDGRHFHCPVCDLIDCKYVGELPNKRRKNNDKKEN